MQRNRRQKLHQQKNSNANTLQKEQEARKLEIKEW
jgi:hypothetical protein